MADLYGPNGETLVEDLTPAELARLQDEGLDVPEPDPDGDGSGGGDADGPQPTDDDTDADGGDGGDGGASDDGDHTPDDDTDADGGGDADAGPDMDPDADGGGDADDGGDPTDGSDDDGDAPGGDAGGPDDDASPDADPDGDGDGGDADGTDPDYADDDTGDTADGGQPDDPDAMDPDDWDMDDLDDLGDWDDDMSNPDPDANGDDGDDVETDQAGDDTGGDPGDGDPGDDTDADTDAGQTGGDADTGGGGGAQPDDLDDEVDDMLDRSDNRGLDPDDLSVDPSMDADWDDRLDRARETADGIRQDMQDRDERIRATHDDGADYSTASPAGGWHLVETHGRAIRRKVERDGTAGEVANRFEKIKQAPKAVNAKKGSRLDRKRLTRYKMGDPTARDFYKKSRGSGARAVHALGLCLDGSGSMDDYAVDPPDDATAEQKAKLPTRMDVAKEAAGVLAHAADQVGDEFVARGFKRLQEERDDHPNYGDHRYYAPLITAPGEQFQWDHLDAVDANGGTPMGYGIVQTAETLRKTQHSDRTMFVVCDGAPDMYPKDNDQYTRRADTGVEDTRRVIEEVRNSGIGVVGIGCGDVEREHMDRMFDGRWVMADARDLPDTLATLYERELNR